MAKYFPLFTNIEDHLILILGGNKASLSKIKRLLPYSPKITVVSHEFHPEIKSCDVIEKITSDSCDIENFICKNLPTAVIITDDVNFDSAKIYALCKENNIPVNTADCPEFCTFFFPSMITKGKLTVAFSTSGASPATAVKLRESLEEILPSKIDTILDWLAALRPVLRYRDDIPREAYGKLYRALTDAAFEKNEPLSEDETEAVIKKIISA